MADPTLRGPLTDLLNGRKPLPPDEGEPYLNWVGRLPAYQEATLRTGLAPDPHEPRFRDAWDAWKQDFSGGVLQASAQAPEKRPSSGRETTLRGEHAVRTPQPNFFAGWSGPDYGRGELVGDLQFSEGLNLSGYDDGNGHMTFGWGANADSGLYPELRHRRDPIEEDTAFELLRRGIEASEDSLDKATDKAWRKLEDDEVQRALVELMFVKGQKSFEGDRQMLAAIRTRDRARIADALRISVWYQQLAKRRDEAKLKNGWAHWDTRPEILEKQIRTGARRRGGPG